MLNLHAIVRNLLAMLAIVVVPLSAGAVYPVSYEASVWGNAGSGDFAPYYIASNNHGILSQTNNALLRLGAWRDMDMTKRFSYGYGVSFVTGYGSGTGYERYNPVTNEFYSHEERPSSAWLQQLYGEIKYRGVFMTVGLKEQTSKMLNTGLSSGDLVESGNARPIPEVRAGFNDFQDIPFTNGWVQIDGEISYGKFTDNNYMRNHYNYYNYHLTTGSWYTYKQAYFRTKPSERFSVTIGAQAAGVFGGTTVTYRHGKLVDSYKHPDKLGEFFEMFIPRNTSEEGFVLGNHLGSWDFMVRYRFKNDDELKGYFQWLWEDGSGIGKLNGYDGLWGIEYKSSRKGIVNGAVVEYLDFTNQSGPMHWDPDDFPGTTITDRAEGGDNYYNNSFYNSYANYGMSIGTPFLRAPIYNCDGYPAFVCTRVRGVHIGLSGNITSPLEYRVLFSYRKGWGTGLVPLTGALDDTSVSVDATYRVPSVSGLSIKAQVALDNGSMYGDNIGGLVTVSYNGIFNFGKR